MSDGLDIGQRLWLRSPEPEQTRRAGECLSRAWSISGAEEGRPGAPPRGRAVSLQGDLGAGKTVFVKGLARGIGIDEESVSSPTFVLANQYPRPASGWALHHVDFYRLEARAELETMGFYDLMGPGILLAVEWGSKFFEALPGDRVELTIEMGAGDDPEDRLLWAAGTGPEARALLAAWHGLLLQSNAIVGVEGSSEASA